jgi:hypothetical protein
MTSKPKSSGGADHLDQKRAEALGLALTKSLGGLKNGLEKQNATILGLVAIVASLPETANVNPRRVGAVVEMMLTSQPDNQKLREELTQAVGKVLVLARKLQQLEPPDQPPGPPN